MYFDDVVEGYSFVTESKIVTGTEVDLVAQISGMDLPAFLSDEVAAQWGYKARVVPGAYLLCYVISLLAKQGFLSDAIWAKADNIIFKSAAHPGDRLYVENQVEAKKLLKDGKKGLVTYNWVLKNQHDVVLVQGTNSCAFPVKPTE